MIVLDYWLHFGTDEEMGHVGSHLRTEFSILDKLYGPRDEIDERKNYLTLVGQI